MTWWAQYIGMPFGGGQGMVTCWELVRRVYADQLGVDLPSYGETSSRYLAAVARLKVRDISMEEMQAARLAVAEEIERGRATESWQQVEDPREFDVVLMKNIHSRRVGHVGVMVDQSRMIHAECATGVALVPICHISVSGRIVGFGRLAQ